MLSIFTDDVCCKVTDPPKPDDFGCWLSGFVDGEGCFVLDTSACPKGLGVRCRAYFSVGLRADDSRILSRIMDYFGCGGLYAKAAKSKANPSLIWRVSSLDDIIGIILPFFRKYGLNAKKAGEFEVWKKGVLLLDEVRHRSLKGSTRDGFGRWTVEDVDAFKAYEDELYCLHEWTDRVRPARWENAPAVGIPRYVPNQRLDDVSVKFGKWLSGFTDGEGCFNLDTSVDRRCGRTRCRAIFKLGLRMDDRNILERIIDYFGCGTIADKEGRGSAAPSTGLQVCAIKHLADIIVPFFERFPLRAKKAKDFAVWKRGVAMIHRARYRTRVGNGKKGFYRWWDDEIKDFQSLVDELHKAREYTEDYFTISLLGNKSRSETDKKESSKCLV